MRFIYLKWYFLIPNWYIFDTISGNKQYNWKLMKKRQLSQKKVETWGLILFISSVAFFLGWVFGVEPIFRNWIENYLGHSIYDLPEILSFLIVIGVGVLFPSIICGGIWAYAYYAWFIPSKTRLANEQISKLTEARKAMKAASGFLESFENELRTKSAEAERLREEVLSLELLNNENTKELESKLNAMESLKHNRIWFERAFSFGIGFASSFMASFLIEFFQHKQ